MSSPLSILFELPRGRHGLALSVLSALSRAGGIILIAEALVRAIIGGSPTATWVVLGLLGAGLRGLGLWADRSLGAGLAGESRRLLRSRLLTALLRGRGRPRVDAAVTATRGIDDLDDYFTTVVPALSSAAVVPVVLLTRIVFTDLLSAFIIAICLPLVPVFMILIGRYTAESTAESSTALERLSDHLAELAEGLPVLIGLGRSRDHAKRLRELGEKYHTANLATLRIAFLSSLALELIATISVALVAVVIGLRLVNGSMDLGSGLLVLLLAPECFIPLRELGAGYHASENGRESRNRAQALIDEAEESGARPAVGGSGTSLPGPDHQVTYPNGTRISWTATIASSPGVTVVAGRSGAGKSTILAALTDTLPAGAETTLRPMPAAFVPQTPRLFAHTLGGELDLFGLPHEQQFEALTEARLPVDVEMPTAALSLGQQRRLALVRILPRLSARAEVLVLDEPTAHLDDDNAAIIIDLIAEAARTIRVVAASHDDRVRSLADTEFAPSRTVIEVPGSAVTPAAVAGAAAEAPTTAGTSANADRGSGGAGTRIADHDGAVAERFATDGNPVATPPERDGTPETLPARDGHRHGRPGTASANSPWTAVLRRRWSILRSSLPLLNPTTLVALLASCGSSLAAIALTAVSAWLIVEASYQPPIMILLVAIVGVRFFGLSRSVLLYLSRLKLHSAIFSSLGRLRAGLWRHFEKVGMSDRTMLTSDAALRSMVSDADDVRDLVPRTLFPPIASALVLIAVVIAAGMLDPSTVVLFIGIGALNLVLLPVIVIATESSVARRARDERSRILGLLARGLGAKDDLRANRADAAVLAELQGHESRLVRAQRASARGFGLAQLWVQLSTVATALAASLISDAPTEILAVLVLMALGLGEVFSAALGAFRQWPALGIVLDRLPDLGESTSAETRAVRTGRGAPNSDAALEDADRLGAGALRVRELDLEAITVGWDGEPVLREFDLHAEQGRWTLLCGASGSGKSTALSILLRFLDPWSGSYRATDAAGSTIDMSELAPSDLVGRIAWCPQEAHIFRSTVRGNLALARKDTPTAEEMFAALRTAGLEEWAHGEGLDLWVGDHGADVSGGQRQRLAVARTLLSGAEVIVLDEPTAHLDAETATALMEDLRENLRSRTVVMVTHDHDLIAAEDRVINLGEAVSPASSRT
ncbi:MULTISPECIES: thiol reductant ABC exporter subunit CydC [unclassified Brevibacterium]|uniref:thiol reductant ABC exporter subunit CydC n=1 Tax=unclassified Brevibacterium TaxID=2614124 RepID=UPI001E40A616|nr:MULTISPECIES: thiol reductant ABC exporter subunit CydC [unclassified Brevibacterium]MCD1285153.1 thiol reductant ABC exporter subunit CydC [Brevibacterium sp. CCUG 69071]MDK8435224.1 thiol reductant ABC exporter subunit CydC [Brevibacterium sp. H-BE7]